MRSRAAATPAGRRVGRDRRAEVVSVLCAGDDDGSPVRWWPDGARPRRQRLGAGLGQRPCEIPEIPGRRRDRGVTLDRLPPDRSAAGTTKETAQLRGLRRGGRRSSRRHRCGLSFERAHPGAARAPRRRRGPRRWRRSQQRARTRRTRRRALGRRHRQLPADLARPHGLTEMVLGSRGGEPGEPERGYRGHPCPNGNGSGRHGEGRRQADGEGEATGTGE